MGGYFLAGHKQGTGMFSNRGKGVLPRGEGFALEEGQVLSRGGTGVLSRGDRGVL